MMTDHSVSGLRVGEIAAVTGLTVRSLHHYEDIGLVVPSGRSSAGHRLYDAQALDRLFRVSLLRSLGLSLTQIRAAIDGGPPQLRDAIAAHLSEVDQQAAQQQRLRSRLVALVEHLDTRDAQPHELLKTLEEVVASTPALDRRISILVYSDLETAHQYLVEVFGFDPGALTRDEVGIARHAVVQAGDGEVWLHAESESFGLASPQRLGAATATMAVHVDDVDEHYRRTVEHGANIRYEPMDQPYGFREYGATDLEGHLWSFMRPLP